MAPSGIVVGAIAVVMLTPKATEMKPVMIAVRWPFLSCGDNSGSAFLLSACQDRLEKLPSEEHAQVFDKLALTTYRDVLPLSMGDPPLVPSCLCQGGS